MSEDLYRLCGLKRRPLTRPRVRAYLISWRGFHYVRDAFPEGTFHRLWLGCVLVTLRVPA